MERLFPEPGIIYFFYTLVEEVKNLGLLDSHYSVLSEGEKNKSARYIFDKDKNTCLATRMLIRYLLSACTGIGPEFFSFKENQYGKPEIEPGFTPPLSFNLSHSHGITTCALALGGEIGVDIEKYDTKIDLDIAQRYFARAETDFLSTHPAKDRHEVFYDLWTLKESYIKAMGQGLSMNLDGFSFTWDQNNTIHFKSRKNNSPANWKFFSFSPLANFKAAISFSSPSSRSHQLQVYKCVPFKKIEIQSIHPTLFSR